STGFTPMRAKWAAYAGIAAYRTPSSRSRSLAAAPRATRTYAKSRGGCRPAAAAPARTHSAERRACSGVSQLKSTASATSPATRANARRTSRAAPANSANPSLITGSSRESAGSSSLRRRRRASREDLLHRHGPGPEEDEAQAGGEQRELELVAANEAHLEADGQDGNDHLDGQEGGRQPGAQTEDERQPAEDLHGHHDDRRDGGQRDPHLGHEASGAAQTEDEELLGPVNREDQPDDEPEGDQSPVHRPGIPLRVHGRSSRVQVPSVGRTVRCASRGDHGSGAHVRPVEIGLRHTASGRPVRAGGGVLVPRL